MVGLSVLTGAPAQQSNNWTTVTNKKSILTQEKLEEKLSTMNKTKITIMIRVPSNAAADFSAAEVHLATIRELSKQDANIVVLNHKGTSQVNIHKSFGHEKYKEFFRPREKSFKNGSVQVSVAHHLLTEIKSFNKALMIPFLKKNKVYIFFNQKEGLEHFSPIGVLFGPHPEFAWRQTIVDRLIATMKADITEDDCKRLNSTIQEPNLFLTITPQQISNPKHNQTKSIALEVRVPAAHESVYIDMIDRLNERACTLKEDEIDIILDDSIGTFFPYYAKRNKPELFELMMRKQNFAMNTTSAIPIFGYTNNAQEIEVEYQGMEQRVGSIIWNHSNIMAIKPTASSSNLGKYMVLVDRECKEDVEDFIDGIFSTIPELDGQPEHFRKPQRGGNSFRKNRADNISHYLKKLEEQMKHDTLMGGDDDSKYSTSPPARSRRPTISYAQATKRLSFQNETILDQNPKDNNTNSTQTTTMSTLTQSSLNNAIANLRKETENSINELRAELKLEVKNMETNITTAVITAIQTNTNNMDMEQMESASMASSQTATTEKSVMDKIDSLAQIVQLLAEKVQDIASIQEENLNKRSRSLEPRKILSSPSRVTEQDSSTHSPPAKLPRPTARIPSPKPPPPPNGIPTKTGTQEGNKMSANANHHLDLKRNQMENIRINNNNAQSNISRSPRSKTNELSQNQSRNKKSTTTTTIPH
jgi:hypothetical protein